MPLRHIRGRKATMPQLLEGQFAVTKDTEQIFAGIAGKNVRALDEKDKTELLEAINNVEVDTTNLATKPELNQVTSQLADIQEQIDDGLAVDTSNLATKEELAQTAQMIGGTSSNLNGKKWIVIGDSITDVTARATKNYHGFIADWTQCIVINKGVSGTGYFTPHAAGANNEIYKRIPSLPSDADIISVFAGTNDWGEVGKSLVLGSLGDTDGSSSFYGAVDSTLSQLIAKYPTKTIAVFTPLQRANAFNNAPNASGITLKQVVNAIIDVCEKYGIPVLDLYRLAGLFPWNTTVNQTYFSSPTSPTGDGLHPNALGHEKIARIIYQFMNSLVGTKLYVDSTAPNVPTGLKSTPGNTQVILKWDANSESDLAGYNVYMNGTKKNTAPITNNSFTVTGLTNGTNYSFQITAVDISNNESARTTSVTGTPFLPPVGNVMDTFTRENNTTSLGTSDTGHEWEVISGVWGISSNQAYSVSGTDTAAVIDSGISNGNVEVKLPVATVYSRIVFRATDNNNYYIAQMNQAGTTMHLFKRQNSTSFTNIGSVSMKLSNNDVLRVNLNGSTITLFHNGTSVLTVTDTHNQSATKHGIGSNDRNTRFDDFKVTT